MPEKKEFNAAVILDGPEVIAKVCIALIDVLMEASCVMGRAKELLEKKDYEEVEKIVDACATSLPRHVLSIIKAHGVAASDRELKKATDLAARRPTTETFH